MHSDIKKKLEDELRRRVDSSRKERTDSVSSSSKGGIFNLFGYGTANASSNMGNSQKSKNKDSTKPVIQISIDQLNRGEKPTVSTFKE